MHNALKIYQDIYNGVFLKIESWATSNMPAYLVETKLFFNNCLDVKFLFYSCTDVAHNKMMLSGHIKQWMHECISSMKGVYWLI